MNKIKNKCILIPIAITILSLCFLGFLSFQTKSNYTKDYASFLSDIESSNITKVVLNTSKSLTVFAKDGSKYITDNPNTPTFKEDLLLKNIEVLYENTQTFGKTVSSSILVISVFSIILMTLQNGKSKSSSMTNLDVKDFSKDDNNNFSFDMVAGNDETKESLMDIVDFLKNPEKYSKYGARIPKGVILYGSPGTGKTLLAKAVAGEAKVPFYALSRSDFVQVYVGVGAARVRNLFKKAKSHGKAVIFIDEIDAIGKARAGGAATQGDISQTTEMAMITEYGMGKTLGLLQLSSLGPLSQSYGNPIVEECRELVNSLYNETLELLKSNKSTLDKLSQELLEKETLESNELYNFL